MIQRPKTCTACPLHTLSRPGFCPDKIPAKAEIILHGEAPGGNELVSGEPFVGKAGFVLHNWILAAVPHLKVKWDQGKIGLANVLRCLPPKVQGRPYPQGDTKRLAEETCRQYDAWPSTVHTVVLFGEFAQRLYFGKELDIEDTNDRELGRKVKGVMGRIGRVYERDGIRYIFCVHPAAILRQPSIVKHAQEALKIAANTAPFYEPVYEKWETTMRESLS